MSRNLLLLNAGRNDPSTHTDVVDPSSAHKASTGYFKGAVWINTASSSMFVLTNDQIPTWMTIVSGSVAKSNLAATTNPTVTSDSVAGYAVGSHWFNTANREVFANVDATPGAAIWVDVSGAKTNFTAIVDPAITDDNTLFYSPGSVWLNTVTSQFFTAAVTTAGAAVWKSNATASLAATFPTSPSVAQIFHNTTNDLTYIWDGNSWIDIVGAGLSGAVTNNYAATTPPTITSDSTLNYSVGSMWLDITSKTVFVATSVAVGSATWFQFKQEPTWVTVTTSPYASLSNASLFVDTAIIPISISLPLAPNAGDSIRFTDDKGTFNTNNLTILRNGNTIMGSATDMIISTSNQFMTLTYNGTDWRRTA